MPKLDKAVTFGLMIIAVILMIFSMYFGMSGNKEISISMSAPVIIISLVIIANGIRKSR